MWSMKERKQVNMEIICLKNIAAASIPRKFSIAYVTKPRFNKENKKGKSSNRARDLQIMNIQ